MLRISNPVDGTVFHVPFDKRSKHIWNHVKLWTGNEQIWLVYNSRVLPKDEVVDIAPGATIVLFVQKSGGGAVDASRAPRFTVSVYSRNIMAHAMRKYDPEKYVSIISDKTVLRVTAGDVIRAIAAGTDVEMLRAHGIHVKHVD